MEHRIGRRKNIFAPVELWQGDLKRGDFELLNIGLGGLFLKGENTLFHEGETFIIKLPADNEIGINGNHLKVMVVHQSAKGAGLMWAGCHTAFISKLENILSQAA